MEAMQIVREVAAHHGVTVAQLRAKGRSPQLVQARMDAAQRISSERNLTLGVIGRILGRSDATILYYLKPDMRARKKARNRARWIPRSSRAAESLKRMVRA